MRIIEAGYKKVYVGDAEEIARAVADIYAAILKAKPNAVLGFATGSTPLPLYAELVRRVAAGEMSFADVTTFNLDEYVGLEPTHDQSYRYFMDTNLFNHIDVDPTRVHVPSGISVDAETLAAYDAAIVAAGGIDMQLLGIGCNGHIGFNEPDDVFSKGTHCVDLTESTIQANSRLFDSIDEVPREAYTMGIGTIMRTRKILLVANGADKAPAVRDALFGPVQPGMPASILQLHPNVTVVLDAEAASLCEL
ncbi:MAG: glucosamine-6-phosphate deaminase [Eggerthellaceae bacterium]|nr:glucosamine-6-phosphate deaminase [Eggerthellaceae bacterium]